MKIAPTYAVGESSKAKIGGGNKKQVQREGTWLQGIFAWCFFTLGWAMMCRSVTTATTLLTQLSWAGDCICISFDGIKSKSDKIGEKQHPRHVYANPLRPCICPFLALAVHIFWQGHRMLTQTSNFSKEIFKKKIGLARY